MLYSCFSVRDVELVWRYGEWLMSKDQAAAVRVRTPCTYECSCWLEYVYEYIFLALHEYMLNVPTLYMYSYMYITVRTCTMY